MIAAALQHTEAAVTPGLFLPAGREGGTESVTTLVVQRELKPPAV
jgi:hypothetical protein